MPVMPASNRLFKLDELIRVLEISPEEQVSVERRSSPGNVYTVGQGDVGQLGLGPDVMECSRPAQVQGLKDVVDVVAGGMHTLCLTADGKVWSFGCNDEGALGRQTVEPRQQRDNARNRGAPRGRRASDGRGTPTPLRFTVSGKVYLWGNFRDSRGQMGLITAGKAEPEPKLIASGSDHVAMLTAKGDLLTMGCGEQGQLGRLPTRTAPRRACAACTRAAQAHQSLHTQTQSRELVMSMPKSAVSIAPAKGQVSLSLLDKEHAKELSLSSIYFCHPRKIATSHATPFAKGTCETCCSDLQGMEPAHVLYVAMKVIRFNIVEMIVTLHSYEHHASLASNSRV
ncbi:hypothetical protein HPB51_005096 [Rhipicephalus microplus]|uniref:Uncharacterized protein n=1 Tax=Rhipicephalus microplus TaxID=6941 RepID=A0A9J6E702_RHIMP|nr:hypothetical protein HPB51_005096 [Rhipicephalus microplus]